MEGNFVVSENINNLFQQDMALSCLNTISIFEFIRMQIKKKIKHLKRFILHLSCALSLDERLLQMYLSDLPEDVFFKIFSEHLMHHCTNHTVMQMQAKVFLVHFLAFHFPLLTHPHTRACMHSHTHTFLKEHGITYEKS